MLYLILGTPDSGKSKRAEDLICAGSDYLNKYYVATMIPFGSEGENRVKKHRNMREGKGFITLEVPFDVDGIIPQMDNPGESAVLLECISNLVANEMFERNRNCEEIPDIIENQISAISENVKDLYVVSNDFSGQISDYDDETGNYIYTTNKVNERLLSMADRVEVMGNEHI